MKRTTIIFNIFVVLLLFTFVFKSQAKVKQLKFKQTPFIIKSDIYLGNLDGQIDNIELKVDYLKSDVDARISLSDLLYKRASYTGSLFEIQKALDQLYRATQLANGDSTKLSKIFVLKAIQELSLHRFKQSEISLGLATKNGALGTSTASINADLNWNKGRYHEAINFYEQDAKENPSVYSVIRVAILKHQTGYFKQANSLYKKAIAMFNSANPVVYSWLLLQYGIHKLELDQLSSAKEIFQKSVTVCPEYVLALEHLAETEAKLGNLEVSIKLYEKVIKLSSNPEFKAQLSYLYKSTNKVKQAKKLLSQAKKGYESRLKKYPNAMGAHASAFFLENGKAKIALKLLQENVILRPNSESYVSLAEVQSHLKMIKPAKENIKKALSMPIVSKALCELSRQLNLENSLIPKACSKY